MSQSDGSAVVEWHSRILFLRVLVIQRQVDGAGLFYHRLWILRHAGQGHKGGRTLNYVNSLCRPMALRAAGECTERRNGQVSTQPRWKYGYIMQHWAAGPIRSLWERNKGYVPCHQKASDLLCDQPGSLQDRGRCGACDGRFGGTTNWGGACDISLHVEFLNEVTLASLHRRSLERGPPGP